METLAAEPRRGKRRKPEAPNSRAPESSPGGAAGGEEDDGVDRISSLPDAILGDVISLLPAKDAARTRILATRWRHLWRSAPLNLDASEHRCIYAVFCVLADHWGPGRRFRFPAQRLWDSPAAVDAWLRSPALDSLQGIDCFPTNGSKLKLPRPPASAFRFSSSLCVASFSECHLSDDITQALQFPRLKKLALQRVRISDNSLHSIIAAAPVLEGLLLRGIFGLSCVRINSASLTSVGVGAVYDPTMAYLEEFIVEDAPFLKRILYLRSPKWGRMRLRLSVISAPNLETLGCLSYCDDSSRLTLGSTIIEVPLSISCLQVLSCFYVCRKNLKIPNSINVLIQPCRTKEFRIINSTTPACTIKILAIFCLKLSLDVVIDLLRCFPCLEKLYIRVERAWQEEKNLWRRKHRNLIKCLDIRLKKVVLNNYRGIKSHISFATFFVLNAKMLESMTFECESYYVTDRFLGEQHKLLQLEKKASRCARVYFTTKRCEHVFMHINHAHDLSKTDPFECEERGIGVCTSVE